MNRKRVLTGADRHILPGQGELGKRALRGIGMGFTASWYFWHLYEHDV